MRQLRGLAFALGLASSWLIACGSSSAGDSKGASGASAAAAGAAAQGGTAESGGAVQGGSNTGGGGTPSVESGAPGESGDSGTAGGSDAGGAGGAASAQNVFIDQIVITQGGGPQKCLPRSIAAGLPGSADDGRISCFIAELEPGSCDCSQTARAPLPSQLLAATARQLPLTGACGGTSGVSCDTFCGCEIVQAPGIASDPGSELYACQNQLSPAASVNGFCMIDQTRTDESGAPAPLGNPALVSECPTKQARLLRFVGAGEPASGASLFIGCTQGPSGG